MMTLYISCRGMAAEKLDLPMPLEEIKQKMEIVRKKEQSNDVPMIYSIDCPFPNLYWHLQATKLDCDFTLQKLNQLAQAINQMNAGGHHQLSKALHTDHRQTLDELLQTAAHIKPRDISCYEVFPDVTTHQNLGKWLVEHDYFNEKVPQALRPYFDFRSIGINYCNEHDGVLLETGYVGLRAEAMEQVLHEQGILHLTLVTSQGAFHLSFPASEERLAQAKRVLSVDNFAQADISEVQFNNSTLADLIPLDAVNVEEANELASWLQQMEQEEGTLAKYYAALEVEQPNIFSPDHTIAMDADDYELAPESTSEYGKQVLRRIGADDELLDAIDGYMDFAQLGEDSMKEDGVRRTEFGLVRRLSLPYPKQEEIGPSMC